MNLKKTVVKIGEFSKKAREVSTELYYYFCRPQVVMSNSRLNTCATCPLKYKFAYEMGLKGFPSAPLHFGSAIHSALKEFHTKFDLKGKEGTFEELLDELEEVWDVLKEDMLEAVTGPALHRWRVAMADAECSPEEIKRTIQRFRVIYKDEDEEAEYKLKAKKMLEEYFADNALNPNKIIALEMPLKITVKGLDILGYIDRIELTPAGEIEIVDYKTGERSLDEETITLGGDKQSQIYTIMVENKWGKKLKNFYYYYLGKRTKVPCTPPKRLTDKMFEDLRDTADDIKHKRFEPSPGPLCGWCDYEVICPAWKTYLEPFKGIFRNARERGRMTFSYSKMGCFKNCPYNYKKLYVDKIAPKPRHFFAIGHSCHETFEEVFASPYQPSPSQLRTMFEEHWHSEGYPTPEEEEKRKKEGWEWVKNYYDKYIDGKYIPAWAVELYFQLPIGDDYVVIGYIDRLDKKEDGTYQIRDYKTDPKLRDQAAVDKDMQLTFYYWAMRQLKIDVNELSLEFLKFNERVSTSRSPEDIPAFIEEVNKVVGAMAHAEAEYEIHPELGEELFPAKWNKYCGGCDHLVGCPMEHEIRTTYRDKVMNLEESGDSETEVEQETDVPEKNEGNEEEKYES